MCKGANLYEDAGYQLHGSSYVINKLLGTTWLWDRRARGPGACLHAACLLAARCALWALALLRPPPQPVSALAWMHAPLAGPPADLPWPGCQPRSTSSPCRPGQRP